MCFRATTACTFATSQLPKVVWEWCALYILTWKCASRHDGAHFSDIATSKSALKLRCFVHFVASRHNCVQLFISHLARWLCTRRFSEPTFRPSRATNHWKNTVNRDFPTFSRTCIFFLLSPSLLWSSHFFSSPLWLFPPLLFHLSILSQVWLLNVLRQTIQTCGFSTDRKKANVSSKTWIQARNRCVAKIGIWYRCVGNEAPRIAKNRATSMIVNVFSYYPGTPRRHDKHPLLLG